MNTTLNVQRVCTKSGSSTYDIDIKSDTEAEQKMLISILSIIQEILKF